MRQRETAEQKERQRKINQRNGMDEKKENRIKLEVKRGIKRNDQAGGNEREIKDEKRKSIEIIQ